MTVAKWSSLTLTEARTALTEVRGELETSDTLVTGLFRAAFQYNRYGFAGAYADDGMPDIRKELHGLYHPIIAGVAPGCFLSDQWSAVNMGPYYSNLGGAQAVSGVEVTRTSPGATSFQWAEILPPGWLSAPTAVLRSIRGSSRSSGAATARLSSPASAPARS